MWRLAVTILCMSIIFGSHFPIFQFLPTFVIHYDNNLLLNLQWISFWKLLHNFKVEKLRCGRQMSVSRTLSMNEAVFLSAFLDSNQYSVCKITLKQRKWEMFQTEKMIIGLENWINISIIPRVEETVIIQRLKVINHLVGPSFWVSFLGNVYWLDIMLHDIFVPALFRVCLLWEIG